MRAATGLTCRVSVATRLLVGVLDRRSTNAGGTNHDKGSDGAKKKKAEGDW